MRKADNHTGWIVEKLTSDGWIPAGHVHKTRESAEYVLHAYQYHDKEHEFRVYEALITRGQK